MCKKKTNTRKIDLVTFFLTAGIILSFGVFIFCVVIYIINSYNINSILESGMLNSKEITLEIIKIYEELQAYYKDATNFNIISLVYVLISSVFMGTLGLYVQRQKERLDNFEDKREKYITEINELSKKIDNINRNLSTFESKIKKSGKKVKNQLTRSDKSLDKLKIDLENIQKQIKKSEKEQSFLFITQKLSMSMAFAININSICNNDINNKILMSEYATRFRDNMMDICHFDKIDIKYMSKDNLEILKTQIYSIIDILDFALNKPNNNFDKEIHTEFVGYCNKITEKISNK